MSACAVEVLIDKVLLVTSQCVSHTETLLRALYEGSRCNIQEGGHGPCGCKHKPPPVCKMRPG
eukprot:404255-Prymnesium_polylepis.2